MTKRNFFYLGLEPVKSRYTYQLSNHWMPKAIEPYADHVNFISLNPTDVGNTDIKVGAVLDATGRGRYALRQSEMLLEAIEAGQLQDNDIIFLQDFWTPGLDAVWYALDLYNINVKVYAMLHAQSVDEYDFTYDMRHWMRLYELGLDK